MHRSLRVIKALKYLLDINCTPRNYNEFKLEFKFVSNPYFKDFVLTKTFHKTGDNMLKEAIGYVIPIFYQLYKELLVSFSKLGYIVGWTSSGILGKVWLEKMDKASLTSSKSSL